MRWVALIFTFLMFLAFTFWMLTLTDLNGTEKFCSGSLSMISLLLFIYISNTLFDFDDWAWHKFEKRNKKRRERK